MKKLATDSGSVLVFVTLMIVLLMFFVGMGLDTGWLGFSRSMGQRAVDMAALSGAAGLAQGSAAAVKKNVEATINDYVKASSNSLDGTIGSKNVMLVKYDSVTGTIQQEADINLANGVRVAFETKNPYTGVSVGSAVNTGHFLTPLLNLFGFGSAPAATNINVSAVAVYSAIPGIPLALGGCTVSDDAQLFKQTPSGGEDPNNSGWTTYMVKETNTPDIIKRIKAIINCQGGGEASIGTPICLGNGANSPVVEEFASLADPSGQKCYFTPVVDPIKVFNQCDQPIRAWAKLCIKHVCAPPDSNKNPNCTDKGSKYIVADVKDCNLPDSARVGQCFRHTLIREKTPEVAM